MTRTVLALIDDLDQVQWDRKEAGYWQHEVRRDFLLIGGERLMIIFYNL